MIKLEAANMTYIYIYIDTCPPANTMNNKSDVFACCVYVFNRLVIHAARLDLCVATHKPFVRHCPWKHGRDKY